MGYEVVTTLDVKGFHDALTSMKFDLIIMDLHMNSINTEELIKEAKKSIPSIKFLTISGSAPAPSSKHFLQKPFKIDALREKVREILNEPA